jgi:hypothetical protein
MAQHGLRGRASPEQRGPRRCGDLGRGIGRAFRRPSTNSRRTPRHQGEQQTLSRLASPFASAGCFTACQSSIHVKLVASWRQIRVSRPVRPKDPAQKYTLSWEDWVPPRGLEPRTNGLKVRCSTVELEGRGEPEVHRTTRQTTATCGSSAPTNFSKWFRRSPGVIQCTLSWARDLNPPYRNRAQGDRHCCRAADPRTRTQRSGSADLGKGGLHRVGEALDDLVEVLGRGVVRRRDDDGVATRPVDVATHRVTDQSVVE